VRIADGLLRQHASRARPFVHHRSGPRSPRDLSPNRTVRPKTRTAESEKKVVKPNVAPWPPCRSQVLRNASNDTAPREVKEKASGCCPPCALRDSYVCSSNFSLLAPDTLARERQTGNLGVSRISQCTPVRRAGRFCFPSIRGPEPVNRRQECPRHTVSPRSSGNGVVLVAWKEKQGCRAGRHPCRSGCVPRNSTSLSPGKRRTGREFVCSGC
jgi:hypothetical protein